MDLKNIVSLNIKGSGDINNIIKNKSEITSSTDTSKSLVSIDAFKKIMLETVFPVGALYITNTTLPSELSKLGNWELVKNKYIYANTTTGTGGNAYITKYMMPEHKHSVNLTSSEDGKHTHNIIIHDYWRAGYDGDGKGIAYENDGGIKELTNLTFTDPGNHTHSFYGNTDETGGTDKLLPKYRAFHIWIRKS